MRVTNTIIGESYPTLKGEKMKFRLDIQLFAEEPTPPSKTFTQEEVNGLVAKESKSAIEKALKDLGIEDVKSAKEGLAKLKELRDAEKSDLEKSQERIKALETETLTYKQQVLARQQEDSIHDALKSLEYDTSYAKTVFKLADLSEVDLKDIEKVKEVVEKTIATYLPTISKKDIEEFGAGKVEKKNPQPTNIYLEAFKKKHKK